MTSGESADGTEFEAYARLLRALLPRLTGVSIFSASCELIWSNDMVVEPALLRIIGESMRSAREQPGDPGVLINDGEPTYIFWLWRHERERADRALRRGAAALQGQRQAKRARSPSCTRWCGRPWRYWDANC